MPQGCIGLQARQALMSNCAFFLLGLLPRGMASDCLPSPIPRICCTPVILETRREVRG